jgi:hypothetical protein
MMCSRWWQARRLIVISQFFSQVQKMMTSWEAPDLLSFPGVFFKCGLTGCITTWCIITVPSYTWGCHHPLTNAKVRRKGAMRYI